MRDWPFRPDNEGNVEQFNRGKWSRLEGTKDSAGYHLASWTVDAGTRRYKRVHCIVWACHVSPILPGYEVDHIDGNKSNNNIANLRLLTHRENIRAARERIGNWNASKLDDGRMALLLSLPTSWKCLAALAGRWSMSKFTLANIRHAAKERCDIRYQAGV